MYLVLDIDIKTSDGVLKSIVKDGIVTASGYPWKRLTRVPSTKNDVDPGVLNARRRRNLEVMKTNDKKNYRDSFMYT